MGASVSAEELDEVGSVTDIGSNAEHMAGKARVPDLDKIAKAHLGATDESLAADRAERQRFLDSIPHTARKKPVEVSVMQWDGTAAGATPIIDWILVTGGTARYHDKFSPAVDFERPHRGIQGYYVEAIAIDTLEGRMLCRKGDWIIKGVAGEFYPCKPDIFEATYDLC